MLTCQYFTGGVDYVSGPYSVTIPAGETSASFDLSIINDNNIFEGNESFTLTIRTSSLPDRVMTEPFCDRTVTIVDDDCKYFFSCLVYTQSCHVNVSNDV